MSQYSWTWISARTGSSADSVISHVARAILFGLSHEAQRGRGGMLSKGGVPRRVGPPVIVATPTELHQIIYGRPGAEKELKTCLNSLVREGIIDYDYWYYKELHYTTAWTKELAHDVWEALVYESFEGMLGESLPRHLADQLLRKGSTAPDKINMLLGSQGLSRPAGYSFGNLAATSGLSVPIESLREWMFNLAAIQSALYSQQQQSSMFVRDIALLTEIASCPSTSFGIKASGEAQDKEKLMLRARWIEYADVTVSHVITLLREDGSFSTTAAAVGISPDIAANLKGNEKSKISLRES